MKKNLFRSILIISLLIVSSCENEKVEIIKSNPSANGLSMKSNRFVFSSKEELAKFYKEYADASDEKLNQLMMPYYEKGFYSLRPIVTESNEQFIFEHYKKAMIKDDSNVFSKEGEVIIDEEGNSEVVISNDYIDNLDDLEDIVGDDTFAAFLNSEAEIQVADDLYKYTDVGLFITDIEKEAILNEYLVSKNISTDLTVETTTTAKQALINEYPADGLTEINNDISYFKILPPDQNNQENGEGGNSGSGYTPTPGSPAASDPSYNVFVSNLLNCDTDPGLFGNWFGDNYKCIDRYENRRRVKTKAFNYNYLLVYHLGVKCVHQYRGWTGFWRVEATDEIRLVVEAAQFEYDADKLLGNTAVNNMTRDRYYFMNNKKIHYFTNSITLPNYGAPSITYSGLNDLPKIFQDDLSIEFFGTGLIELDNLISNGINSNLTAGRLNSYFYNALYSTVTGQLRTALNNNSIYAPANRTFVAKFPENGKLIFQKSVLTQSFGNGVSKRTFDWGAEFRFNASASADGSWSMSGGQGSVLTRPSNFKVKLIGAARRGWGWHGNKFSVGIN